MKSKREPGSGKGAGGRPKSGRKGAGSSPGTQQHSTQKVRLLEELGTALAEIDEEGLIFLLRQARVLIHNAAVDRLNREEAELVKKAPPEVSAAGPRAAARKTGITVEDGGEGKAAFLVIGRIRKVLSRQEVERLSRICGSADSRPEGVRQLYAVLSRERGDILADGGISGPRSPLMEMLFDAIRERYGSADPAQ
jgi:hypothetical protein